MPKLTVEEYHIAREREIDKVMAQMPYYNNVGVLYRTPPKEQARIISSFTHLKGAEYIESRRELYRKVFDNTFLNDGVLIQPSSNKRTHFLIASTYTSTVDELVEKLLNNDKSLPPALKKAFKGVDNDRTVLLDHMRVEALLPEYTKAKKEGDSYAFAVVYGEVKTLLKGLQRLAKEFGHNIIDVSSSHSREKTDKEIDDLKNIQSDKKTKHYNLSTVGLIGEPKMFLNKPVANREDTPFRSVQDIIKNELKRMANPKSFMRLMEESENSVLLWENEYSSIPKYKYSVVAAAKNGIKTFPRRDLLKKFRDFVNIPVPSYLGQSLYTDYSQLNTSSQKENISWQQREESKKLAKQEKTNEIQH